MEEPEPEVEDHDVPDEPPPPAEDIASSEEPPVEEPVPVQEEAPPAEPVEPKLGFEEFCTLKSLSPPAVAAVRRWLTLQGHTPSGHYTRTEWETFYQATMDHH